LLQAFKKSDSGYEAPSDGYGKVREPSNVKRAIFLFGTTTFYGTTIRLIATLSINDFLRNIKLFVALCVALSNASLC
jgi:hypothetical protein